MAGFVFLHQALLAKRDEHAMQKAKWVGVGILFIVFFWVAGYALLTPSAPAVEGKWCQVPFYFLEMEELVTNNFLPTQKVFATPARGFAIAKHRCAFQHPPRKALKCFSHLHRYDKSAQEGAIVLYLWRWGELNPRAKRSGLGFYVA